MHCSSSVGASTSGRASAALPRLPARRRLPVVAAAAAAAAAGRDARALVPSSPLGLHRRLRSPGSSPLVARAESGGGGGGAGGGDDDPSKNPPPPGDAGKKKKKRRPAPGGGGGAAPGAPGGSGEPAANLNEDLQAFLKRQAAAGPAQTGKDGGSGFLGLGNLFGTGGGGASASADGGGGGGGGIGGPRGPGKGASGSGGGWNWGDEGPPGEDGDVPEGPPQTVAQSLLGAVRLAWVFATNAALFLAVSSWLHRSLEWCCQVELLLLVGAPRQAWEKVASVFFDALEEVQYRLLGWNVPQPGGKIPAYQMVRAFYPPEHAYSFEGSAIRQKGASPQEVALLRNADAARWWERQGGYPGDVDQAKVQAVRDKYDPRGADRRAFDAARRAGKEREYWAEPGRRAWLEEWTGSAEPPAAGKGARAATA